MEKDDIVTKVWEICDLLHAKKKFITKRVVELALQNSEAGLSAQENCDLQKHINSWRLRNLAVKTATMDVKYTPERFSEKLVKLELELSRLRNENQEAKATINKLSAELASLANKNTLLKGFIKKRITSMIEA